MSFSRPKRRDLLLALPLGVGMAISWERRGFARSLPEMTPQAVPLLTGSHVGFTPSSRVRILVRREKLPNATQLTISGPSGFSRSFPIPNGSPLGFDNQSTAVYPGALPEGTYRASLGAGEPFSFEVSRTAWSRTLPILAGYAHHQRCGHNDRASHPVCHLDDARRRDTGARVDTTGGWHDAGDLRKWVDATIMNLFGLTALVRNLKFRPAAGALSLKALLDEARYGNTFFLKMQDTDGLVWADVGGGVHGDNSDNHWTDNIAGNADDRWVNVEKRPAIQAMFVTAQAIMGQLFSSSDPAYSAICLAAAARCWNASKRTGANVTDVAWWTMAAVEMSAATHRADCRQEMARLADQLASLQVKFPLAGPDMVRGFFPMWVGNQQPLRDSVHSALPAVALLAAAQSDAANSGANTRNWNNAARLYLDQYAVPMASRSDYGIVPFGLFLDAPSDEKYRPLSGRYSYRFFMPVKAKGGFAGLSSHLLSHALLFASAAKHFHEPRYRDLALSHLEWVFGANPFGASLVTGIGHNQPPAFSPFVGLIPGGIVNGVAGNEQDQAVLNQESERDWHTNEYWSPHSGYCLWTLSILESESTA